MRVESFLCFPVPTFGDSTPVSPETIEIPSLLSGHPGSFRVPRKPAAGLFEGDRQAKRMNRESFE